MSHVITVAISADFFDAFQRLPQGIQKKASTTISEFRRNPTSPGLNFERIAAHPGMRSIRIDRSYRAIVLHPKKGNVYLLLWVDKHDEAYTWAKRHRCQVNPETGSLQVFEVQSRVEEVVVPVYVHQEQASPKPFAHLAQRQLIQLGVPPQHTQLVKDLPDEQALDNVRAQLTPAGYEALFLILCGSDVAEILAERQVEKAGMIDTEDFAQALQNPYSQAQFRVFHDDDALQMMFSAPQEKWRVYLHPSQAKLARGHKNGATRVLGGAGTGKTVVAMHRARWLAEHVASPKKPVLFTTYTRNLATDIETLLHSICSAELMKRIRVVNLDRWILGYLRKVGYQSEILYDAHLRDKLWRKALLQRPEQMELPTSFYRDEWERVLVPHNITTLEQYKRVARMGRGTRLNRQERVAIWRVFEQYRINLGLAGKKEVDEAYRDATTYLQRATEEHGTHPFSAVVVDEAQDMSAQAFAMLRAMVPEGANDLFIVGDAHQRIYGRSKVVLGQCGINIVGRSHKLRLNYRTTDQIRAEAVRLLEGKSFDDLDGHTDSHQGYKSLTHGDPPELCVYPDATTHDRALTDYLAKLDQVPDEDPTKCAPHQICVVFRSHAELVRVAESLHKAKVKHAVLKAGEGESETDGGIRLATMHRVKGLEFKCMILASMNADQIPSPAAVERCDMLAREEAEVEERALVYVAMTRARIIARIQAYGPPTPFFPWPT